MRRPVVRGFVQRLGIGPGRSDRAGPRLKGHRGVPSTGTSAESDDRQHPDDHAVDGEGQQCAGLEVPLQEPHGEPR